MLGINEFVVYSHWATKFAFIKVEPIVASLERKIQQER